MQTKYNFTKFDNLNEFKNWISSKKVSRKVTRLQVHHTYLPCYAQWPEDELTRQKNMKDYHVNNKWGDIAQHFTIFPNGKIVTGRSLESTPIGITGWNTSAICIEIYGNFDKETMKDEQKEAVITLYGELCKKFNLTPSSDTIRCHSWFTSGGTYLGGYSPSKSAKTCPGTKFTKAFGGLVNNYGNTKDSFEKYFYPVIKKYINGSTNCTTNVNTNNVTNSWKNGDYNCKVKATANLNLREGRGTNYPVIYTIPKGTTFTLGYVLNNWGSTWDFKGKVGYICCDYIEKV